ncbi:TIGR02466 family protein [Sedimentitalea sp. HM32M-2]|uniref:TIGR02466 family protein n=1 Tax=Sedimentitalea sp. HM32M-2 TaxID=3351566 RepID=UPI003637A08F
MTRTIAQLETEGGQDELRRDDYFPTLVYSTMLHDAEDMNKEILAAIYDERDKDSKGIERSNYRSLGGWHSHNNLHKDAKFSRLTRRIHAILAGINSNLGYDPARHLRVTTMWSITNPPLSSNRAHIHPGALWSGVYYVQAPEGAGAIDFTDPRVVTIMNSPSFIPNKRRKTECWTKVKVKPVAGKMLFFPSWLYHSVDPNLAEGDGKEAERIIISFNISQLRKPK